MKIGIFTGTRADYGLLKPLIHRVFKSGSDELCLIVTGMHLSPEFGLTYREIENDGFPMAEKIEILLSSDTTVGLGKSMGLATISYVECLERQRPDIVVILGDRFEALAMAQAAMVSRIPLAHISGGDVTIGQIDEAIRHSITKMSHLHFASTEAYRKRIIQMGEAPERVFNVGALGVESALNLKLMDRESLETSIGFAIKAPTALLTFHPVTLENATAKAQFDELLMALNEFPDLRVIFTKANADADGRMINQMIDDYTQTRANTIAFTSLGQLRYLSCLQYVDFVIGNSSSGITEVPSFKIATINIGDRQKGRLQADSVINCGPNKTVIVESIQKALSVEFRTSFKNLQNPYEKSQTSECIFKTLKSYDLKGILKKSFYDL
jgi:GDP/UDP-N,N'-diacetylbacillosamine 2-epimerase (hydrolysing)